MTQVGNASTEDYNVNRLCGCCLTLCLFRFPGLAGDGLGDFAEWGVDSGLPEVPFTKKRRVKNAKFVNEAEKNVPQQAASAFIFK